MTLASGSRCASLAEPGPGRAATRYLVREAFRRATGPGVVSILEASSLEEAREQMSRLPFVALGILTFEYSELIEL
jgi:hypothetical protein